METIQGKRRFELDSSELASRIAGYKQTWFDLGTGDGRFVRWMAARQPERFFIGIDACRENLRAGSRDEIANALFVIASAEALPSALNGLASGININFPWGSLLAGLLDEKQEVARGLAALARPGASLQIHINADALAEIGWVLEHGASRVQEALERSGWILESRSCMDAQALRAFPTRWSKRLAFGRAPRAIRLGFQKA